MDAIKDFVTAKLTGVPLPEADIQDFDCNGVSMGGVDYLAKIAITNPYPVCVPICEVHYTLKSGTRTILSGEMPDPGSLHKHETTILQVPLKVPHSIVVSIAKDILFDWDIDYELIITLIVDLPVIGNIRIPITKKGEVKLPSIKSVFRGSSNEDDKEKDKEDEN